MNLSKSMLAVSLGLALAGAAIADSDAPVVVPEAGNGATPATTRTSETTTTTTTSATAVAPITEASVATILTNAGYHNIHDIEYKKHKGVWKAEADDNTGADFELNVDATTGHIVHVEDD